MTSPPTTVATSRRETDQLGERSVRGDALYGIHTVRALENFPITGVPIAAHRELVTAFACVKQAAASTNHELGLLDGNVAAAIERACAEVRAGRWHEHFVVDVIQGGAGTSTNMNANEVIANRALELLGHARGDYDVIDPLDHVNLGQSTNDVYPTAVKVALYLAVGRLRSAMLLLSDAFGARARCFAEVLKMGRTQLQDAVPMTVGQELNTFAVMLREDAERLREATMLMTEVNLGGTAIGTGLNAHPRYGARARTRLRELSGVPVRKADDLVEATQDVGAFVQLSGVLKRTAVKLSKVCNDLRLLSSGPRAGLGELRLPAVQAGSSIMPGKVNPVIPEVVNQVAFLVIGHDVTVTMAAEGGQLQLNAFEPVIAHSLLSSVRYLTEACTVLDKRCVRGIDIDEASLRETMRRSPAVITALGPLLGHAVASDVAAVALREDRSVADIVVERGLLERDQVDAALAPAALVPGAF